MTDPTAWKQPRRKHADINDDYVDLLRRVLADMRRDDTSEHGHSYLRGEYDGVYAVMRLTLSDREADALIERAKQ